MRSAWAALACLTALRLAVAAAVPLARTRRITGCGRARWPVATWIIRRWWRCGSAPAPRCWATGRWGVRLLAPLAAALGSVLLVQAGRDFFTSTRAGLLAALLLNATLLFGVGAVTMTPDTPLLFFWTATLWALGRVWATGRGGWWLLAGLAAGLATASKYTAVFLAPGVLAGCWRCRRCGPGWCAGSPGRRRGWRCWHSRRCWPGMPGMAGWGWPSRPGGWGPGRRPEPRGIWASCCWGQGGFRHAGHRGAVRAAGAGVAAGLGAGCGVRLAGRPQPAGGAGVRAACAGRPVAGELAVHPVSAGRPGGEPAGRALAGLVSPGDPAWLRADRAGLAAGGGGAAGLADAAGPDAAAAGRLDGAGGGDRCGGGARGGGVRRLGQLRPCGVAGAAAGPGAAGAGAEGRWALFDLPDGHALAAGRVGLLLRSARRDDRPEPGRWAEIALVASPERARDGMVAEGFRLYRVVGQAAAGQEPLAILPRPR